MVAIIFSPMVYIIQANIILGEYLHPEIEKRENVIKELTAADEISENDVDGDEWEDIYMSGMQMISLLQIRQKPSSHKLIGIPI
jgi:hypothetical protein